MPRPGSVDRAIIYVGTLRETLRWTRPAENAHNSGALAPDSARAQVVLDRQAVLTFDSDRDRRRAGALTHDGTIELHA